MYDPNTESYQQLWHREIKPISQFFKVNPRLHVQTRRKMLNSRQYYYEREVLLN